MTNFTEATDMFQRLYAAAPEFFMEIHGEADLERATAFLYHFDTEVKGDGPHPLDPLADALMQRITTYEQARFPTGHGTPEGLLAFLMDQRGLTQQALSAATGINQSVISQLLSRKRAFTADHARALGAFFGVQPGSFL